MKFRVSLTPNYLSAALILGASFMAPGVGRSDPPPQKTWARCGVEGGDCLIYDFTSMIIRFGVDNQFFYLQTADIARIGCNTSFFGDPAQGSAKVCDYVRDQYWDNLTWTKCADDGGVCDTKSNVPILVKYGAPPNTIAQYEVVVYRVASGKVPCNESYFGNPVGPNAVNACLVASVPYSGVDPTIGFTNNCTEYNDCVIDPALGPVVIRFGARDNTGTDQRWVYRIASLKKYHCSADWFGYDPWQGALKYCQYAPLKPGTIQFPASG